jgi:hypothetical protein
VCFSVAGPDGARLTRSLTLPGGRADIRDRSTTVAMHMVRRVLAAADGAPGSPAPGAAAPGVPGSPAPGAAASGAPGSPAPGAAAPPAP